MHGCWVDFKTSSGRFLRWPGMNSQLKQFISSCKVCHSFQRNNPRESLICHFIPDRPWSKIAADLSEFKGEHYRVLVDYYSDWIGFDKMRDQTATETIATLLLRQFSRLGLPHEIFTFCGNNFDSNDFSQFCQRKQIKSNIIREMAKLNQPLRSPNLSWERLKTLL